MNAVDGEEAKPGKRAGNYGVCKGMLGLKFPTPQKRNFLISLTRYLNRDVKIIIIFKSNEGLNLKWLQYKVSFV
jgi:hypothetical protein